MVVKEEAQTAGLCLELLSHFELRRHTSLCGHGCRDTSENHVSRSGYEKHVNQHGNSRAQDSTRKPPPILFDIPQPKPLREALLKLKVHKETVNKLNQVYINGSTSIVRRRRGSCNYFGVACT
jgi:hypothetical protein